MAKFNTGQSFADGDTVTGAKLNNITSQLNIYTGVISEQTAMVATVSTADQLLIADTDNGDSGSANRVTVQKLLNDTLSNGTYTNANLTGATITTGTIATLNSTTGTIATGVIPTLTSITKITSGTGTAAAPAISPTGDTNTGIFFPAADTIALAEGGAEAMRIDASGNVGIGTTTATAAFQGAASKLGIEAPRVSSDQTLLSLAHTGTITAADKINIGFDSFSSTNARRTMAQISALNENPTIGNPGSLLLYTNAGAASLTERMRIDSSGNVGIGITSPTTKLDVDGELKLRANGAEGGQLTFLNTGNASTGLTVDVSTADVGRIFSTSNNSSLQIGQLAGTGGIINFYTSATERLRIASSGQIGIGGTNYGTSGQVLTSGGAAAAPSWSNANVTFPTLSTSTTEADNVASRVARAWVNFDGTGTVAIRASLNVSSITDNGTGDYTINFTTAMQDANYAMTTGVITSGIHAGKVVSLHASIAPTAAAARVTSGKAGGDGVTGSQEDLSIIMLAFFR